MARQVIGMTETELRVKYPYMFEGPSVGLDLYPGWIGPLAAACVAADELLGEDKAGFHFRKIKEKYGTARIFWESSAIDEEVDQKICALFDAAEKATESLCMLCGVPARVENYSGWWLCLCEPHGREREARNRAVGRKQ